MRQTKGSDASALAQTAPSTSRASKFPPAIGALQRFRRDQSGAYVVAVALAMPVLVGFAGLALDIGSWYNTQQTMQGAADSAAASAGAAYAASPYGATFLNNMLNLQADSVASTYGFINAVNGVSVTVNNPPLSGPNATKFNAIEVIISQPQRRFFTSLFSSDPVIVRARSVALGYGGLACVLALDPTATGAVTTQGTPAVTLNNCSLFSDSNSATSVNVSGSATISALAVGAVGGVSGASNITTVQGVTTGDSPISDPYANVPVGSIGPCDYHNYSPKGTITLNPGVFCGGMSLQAGANVTLNPGVYYMDQGSLTVNGSATLTGVGVTIIFTSSTGANYATATINGGATVNLSPPTSPSAPTRGITLFGDHNMPVGTAFKLNGGASQNISGATYIPKGAVQFAGNNSAATSCAQLIGNTLTFSGAASFAVNCPNSGMKPMGSSAAKVIE